MYVSCVYIVLTVTSYFSDLPPLHWRFVFPQQKLCLSNRIICFSHSHIVSMIKAHWERAIHPDLLLTRCCTDITTSGFFLCLSSDRQQLTIHMVDFLVSGIMLNCSSTWMTIVKLNSLPVKKLHRPTWGSNPRP